MSLQVKLDISEKNEGTSYPWWVILTPVWATRKRLSTADVFNAVYGPFFSREEAESELNSRRHFYGKYACVWCMSGCYSKKYINAIKNAQNDK
jgi:hypothetical protein